MQASNKARAERFQGLPVVAANRQLCAASALIAREAAPDAAELDRIRAEMIAEKIVAFASPEALIRALTRIADTGGRPPPHRG